jgi:hypothetical protein
MPAVKLPSPQMGMSLEALTNLMFRYYRELQYLLDGHLDEYNVSSAKVSTDFTSFLSGTYATDVGSFQTQLDGKIETYYTDVDPNTWDAGDRTKHTGDMWYAITAKLLKRYNGTTNLWDLVEDAKAVDAYTNAATAQDTADGKRRVFTTEPTTPYDIGDLWTGGSASDLKHCITQRLTGAYNAADWDFANFPIVDGTTTSDMYGFTHGLIINASNQLSLEDRPQKAYGTASYTDSFEGPDYIYKFIPMGRLLFQFRLLTILVKNKGDAEKFLLYQINPYYDNVTGFVIGVNSTPKTICVLHAIAGSSYGISETVGTVGHDIVTADAAHKIGITVKGIDTDGYLNITFSGTEAGTQSLNCDIYWMLS